MNKHNQRPIEVFLPAELEVSVNMVMEARGEYSFSGNYVCYFENESFVALGVFGFIVEGDSVVKLTWRSATEDDLNLVKRRVNFVVDIHSASNESVFMIAFEMLESLTKLLRSQGKSVTTESLLKDQP